MLVTTLRVGFVLAVPDVLAGRNVASSGCEAKRCWKAGEHLFFDTIMSQVFWA